jgi:hypothetical protein
MTTVAVWLRKDLHRFAIWIGVWLALLALRVAADLGGPAFWIVRTAVDTLPSLGTTVLFTLLAALVVHEDPPTDPRAFWPTRAISGRQLFAAKCIFVGLVLVLPVTAVETYEIAATGVTGRIVALAAAEALLDWTAWGAVTVLLAALTRSFPGFIGAAMATYALAIASRIAVTLSEFAFHLPMGEPSWTRVLSAALIASFGDDSFEFSRPPLVSRALGMTAVVAVVGILVAGWAYVGRRRSTAWAMAAAGFLGLSALAMLWPVDLAPAADRTPPVGVAAPKLEITVDPVGRRAVDLNATAGSQDMEIVVDSHVKAPGVEPPQAVEIKTLTVALVHSDRRSIRSHPIASSWNHRVVESLLDGARLVNRDTSAPDTMRSLMHMPAADFERRRGEAGRLEVNVGAAIRDYAIGATIPLRSGARIQRREEQVVIERVTLERGECTVQLRGARVSLLLEPGRSTIRSRAIFRDDPDTLYVLRNRRRGQALVADTLMGAGGLSRGRLDRINWVLVFRAPRTEPLMQIDDDFLRDADLVRIEATTVGQAQARTSVEPIAIDPTVWPLRPLVPSPPTYMDAQRPDVPDDASIVFATLSDEALMTLDWYGPTRRDAGMTVVAKRDVPGPGIEIDVEMDPSPTRGVRPTRPAPAVGASPTEQALERSIAESAVRGQALYFVSSAFGGEHALAGIDLRNYDSLYLRLTLVRIDGHPPDYNTPQLKVGLVAGEARMATADVPLDPPDWSAAVWGDTTVFGESATSGERPKRERAREIGIVVRPDDPRWAGRAAAFTLRVEPIDNAIPVGPSDAARLRRATLSPATIGSMVPEHGKIFLREPTDAGGVDFDLELDRDGSFLRLPDDVASQVVTGLREFDVLELQATLIAIDGESSGHSERIGVMFVDAPARPPVQLSLTLVQPSTIVSTPTARVEKRVGWEIARFYGSDDVAEAASRRTRSVTVRLAPAPGATQLR